MIRRGRTGPCSSTPSSGTSCRTFRSSISPSTCLTAGTTFEMWKTLHQIARVGIATEALPEADEALRLRDALQARIRAILGRALAIRQVDAGSCNGCELEIHALNNPVYNIEG